MLGHAPQSEDCYSDQYMAHMLLQSWDGDGFHIAAITTGVFTFLLLFIKESRPSRLLAQRLSALHDQTGLTHLQINSPDRTPNLRTFARVALRRPIPCSSPTLSSSSSLL
ncbi:hypothetical protein ONS96_007489 [Cadophora gregata f. sp. sojae]|nr:hypothetical protein ONS96_007489 [Cadophora gregata f. sp. sojae]